MMLSWPVTLEGLPAMFGERYRKSDEVDKVRRDSTRTRTKTRTRTRTRTKTRKERKEAQAEVLGLGPKAPSPLQSALQQQNGCC